TRRAAPALRRGTSAPRAPAGSSSRRRRWRPRSRLGIRPSGSWPKGYGVRSDGQLLGPLDAVLALLGLRLALELLALLQGRGTLAGGTGRGRRGRRPRAARARRRLARAGLLHLDC